MNSAFWESGLLMLIILDSLFLLLFFLFLISRPSLKGCRLQFFGICIASSLVVNAIDFPFSEFSPRIESTALGLIFSVILPWVLLYVIFSRVKEQSGERLPSRSSFPKSLLYCLAFAFLSIDKLIATVWEINSLSLSNPAVLWSSLNHMLRITFYLLMFFGLIRYWRVNGSLMPNCRQIGPLILCNLGLVLIFLSILQSISVLVGTHILMKPGGVSFIPFGYSLTLGQFACAVGVCLVELSRGLIGIRKEVECQAQGQTASAFCDLNRKKGILLPRFARLVCFENIQLAVLI